MHLKNAMNTPHTEEYEKNTCLVFFNNELYYIFSLRFHRGHIKTSVPLVN